MHHVVASLVLIAGLAPHLAAQGSGAGSAPGRSTAGACSLLTKDVVTQVSPYDKQVLSAVLTVAPIEDALGASGSACSYGGVTLQVDPFTSQALDKQRAPAWVPVAEVGDAAYFFDNRGEYAELYARSGAHVLTVQMDVPRGRTAVSIRPNVIALAKAVLPRLK